MNGLADLLDLPEDAALFQRKSDTVRQEFAQRLTGFHAEFAALGIDNKKGGGVGFQDVAEQTDKRLERVEMHKLIALLV